MINQKLLESLLDVTDLFIGIYDVNQESFIKINQYGLEMFHTPSLERFNQTVTKQLLGKQRVEQLVNMLDERKKYEEEAVFYTSQGEPFWGKIDMNYLEHEGCTYFLIRIANIDTFKQAERQALSSEEKFKAVFENAAIGILVTDQLGEIVLANHFMEPLFGYHVHELLGQTVEMLLPDTLKTSHVKHRDCYNRQHKIRPMGEGMELQGQRKDGTPFPVEVSLSYFSNKEQFYAVAFIQDISYKVQVAQQLVNQKKAIELLNENLETEVENRTQALLETLKHLEKSKEDLEQALVKEKELNELKTRFVSMASHEFRTPLSTILSSATLIGKYTTQENQEKREKHIGRIQSSVGYLTDILEEFLSIGRLEEGYVHLHFIRLDWVNLLEEVIHEVNSLLQQGQRIAFAHQGESALLFDKSLLRKIMINLISNASKFSSEGSTIQVNSIRTAASFVVTVKDQGIGISEDDQKHLCERFFRGANAINIQGTGLGLHIVAKYVELLKGKITIQSKLGEGTTIQLTFYPQADHSRSYTDGNSISKGPELIH